MFPTNTGDAPNSERLLGDSVGVMTTFTERPHLLTVFQEETVPRGGGHRIRPEPKAQRQGKWGLETPSFMRLRKYTAHSRTRPCIHLLIRSSSCGRPEKYVWTPNHVLSAFSPFSRVAESLGNPLHQSLFFTLCLSFIFQMALGSEGQEGWGGGQRGENKVVESYKSVLSWK